MKMTDFAFPSLLGSFFQSACACKRKKSASVSPMPPAKPTWRKSRRVGRVIIPFSPITVRPQIGSTNWSVDGGTLLGSLAALGVQLLYLQTINNLLHWADFQMQIHRDSPRRQHI